MRMESLVETNKRVTWPQKGNTGDNGTKLMNKRHHIHQTCYLVERKSQLILFEKLYIHFFIIIILGRLEKQAEFNFYL